MQAADVVAHHAAVIEIRAEHGALLGARHRMSLDAQFLDRSSASRARRS